MSTPISTGFSPKDIFGKKRIEQALDEYEHLERKVRVAENEYKRRFDAQGEVIEMLIAEKKSLQAEVDILRKYIAVQNEKINTLSRQVS